MTASEELRHSRSRRLAGWQWDYQRKIDQLERQVVPVVNSEENDAVRLQNSCVRKRTLVL